MNKRIRFILKRSFFLVVIVLLEILILNQIFNFSAVENRFVILAYIMLILPVVLIYTIAVLLSKIVFSKYNLRKANRFQLRLILSFALVALIPVVPLTFLTNNLVNNSLEIWLTESIEESLDNGLNLVKTLYDEQNDNIKHLLNKLSDDKIVRHSLIFEGEQGYKKSIRVLAKQYNIDSIFIINKKNDLIYEFQQKKLVKNILFKGFREELKKNPIHIVHKNDEMDEYECLLGYCYIYDSDVTKKVIGVLIIGKILPEGFSQKVNTIADSLQSYKQMKIYKKPIVKGITTFVLIIMTLTVFLLAIIVSYFISKNISEPIKILLDGTKRIVAGDLNFEIQYNAKDEIKLLINAFNQMTKQLHASKQALMHSQRLSAWRDVARRIAHEIRNPLTPIKLSIERLVKQQDSKEYKKILKKSTTTILEEVNRMDSLIKEFSSFAKSPQLILQVENINHIVIDVLEVFAGVEGIKFKTELDKKAPPLNLDKKRLTEVLINLINNAIDAIPHKEGIIQIKTCLKANIFGKFVYLELIDNGAGIPPNVIDKIFDPYFTTKEDGTGLGLSIVEKIITEHHAKIKCESEVGKGTKFTIEFTV